MKIGRYEVTGSVAGIQVPLLNSKADIVERRRAWRAYGNASLRGRWTNQVRIEYQRAFGNNGRQNRKEEGGDL